MFAALGRWNEEEFPIDTKVKLKQDFGGAKKGEEGKVLGYFHGSYPRVCIRFPSTTVDFDENNINLLEII